MKMKKFLVKVVLRALCVWDVIVSKDFILSATHKNGETFKIHFSDEIIENTIAKEDSVRTEIRDSRKKKQNGK